MKDFITITLIIGYFAGSVFIGVGQYQTLGELSTNYIVFQLITLTVSVFFTLKFQNSPTVIGDTLATLGGGVAMMIVIQSILFYLIGDVITKSISTTKIIVLVIVALVIIRLVFKFLTRQD